MTLAVGSLLQDNRYQIQAILSSTDVEIVYEAVHTYLNRTVVLKQLRHDVQWAASVPPTGRAVMARLIRLSQCQHPCLRELLDCFEEDRQVYLVLPVSGELTMAQWLQANGPVTPLEMLSHLRSLIDVFDKFHQNGLVYGHLSPDVLQYRAETNEMVVTDISWRMLIPDLLGDRHCLNYSKAIDLQRLAYIAYCFLTGDYTSEAYSLGPSWHSSLTEADYHSGDVHPHTTLYGTISVPNLHVVRTITGEAVENVISMALDPRSAQLLTPTDWFMALEQVIYSEPVPHDVTSAVSVNHSELSHSSDVSPPKSKIRLPKFTIPYPRFGTSGEDALTHTSVGIEETVRTADPIVSASTPDSALTESVQYHEHYDDYNDEYHSDAQMDVSILVDEEPEMDESMETMEDGSGHLLNQNLWNGPRWLQFKRRIPLLLGTTSIVAALSGGFLGYVFRMQDVEKLEQSPLFGNEIFGRDQEFLPSDDWPGLSTRFESRPTVLFERSPRQQTVQAPPEKDSKVLFSNSGADIDNAAASRLPVSDTPDRNSSRLETSSRDSDQRSEISRDSLDDNANLESIDNRLRPTVTSPQKPLKPEAQPPQFSQPQFPQSQSRSSTPSNENLTNPPDQSNGPRVTERPPTSSRVFPVPSSPNVSSSSQPERPTESITRPSPEPQPLQQSPTKLPKSLVTPIAPSGQNQSIDWDGTDVSEQTTPSNQA